MCMYVCTVKENACSESRDENTAHDVGDIHHGTVTVDHNENEQCTTSICERSPHAAIDSLAFVSDDDHTLPCTLGSNNVEASSQAYVLMNDTSDGTYMTGMNNCCTELIETCPDIGMSQNDHTSICASDLTYNLQYNSVAVGVSCCDSDSDLVSQSQDLSNTQKVKLFSLELDLMKTPISTYSSQNSLFDSLTDMSTMLMQ